MTVPIPLGVVVEDDLSLTVALKIVQAAGKFLISTNRVQNGFGEIKRMIRAFNNAARGMPHLVITDLDDAECAAALRDSWLPFPRHHNLLFRVAVREIE